MGSCCSIVLLFDSHAAWCLKWLILLQSFCCQFQKNQAFYHLRHRFLSKKASLKVQESCLSNFMEMILSCYQHEAVFPAWKTADFQWYNWYKQKIAKTCWCQSLREQDATGSVVSQVGPSLFRFTAWNSDIRIPNDLLALALNVPQKIRCICIVWFLFSKCVERATRRSALGSESPGSPDPLPPLN